MLEERRSLGGNGYYIEARIGIGKKVVIIANVNYVSQPLTMRDVQQAVGIVPNQDILSIIIYNIGK